MNNSKQKSPKKAINKTILALYALLFIAPAGELLAAAVTPPACSLNLGTSTLFSDTGAASRTGIASTFTVPANVTTIRIIAVGADGGLATGSATFTGGTGASVDGTFTVTPGQTVTVIPGYAGLTGDNESGGGGASGAYIAGTLAVIAGGGGGDDNTGNGSGGTATNNGSNGGAPAGQDCNLGGLGGIAGAGGQYGEMPDRAQTIACQTGDGGAGGGGFLSAGESSDDFGAIAPAHSGPSGGARCNIAGAVGGISGLLDPTDGNQPGADGGFGVCGGGAADHRESGGGGGYSGGGGGPEGQFPGGGGSFIVATAASTSLIAGTAGGGSGRNGAVRICYGLADITVTKTDGVTAVTPGATTSYVINVGNSGPNSADGALFQDPAVTGLACNSPVVCTATSGAQCPGGAVNGVANVTLASIQAGVAIPTLPNGGNLSFALTCTVTATGL